ncbi:hypothetical protein BASA83_013386 [Batrachochytrium salamandrivorans]|nr:hypothetical protein BASA83_013386 [Batrachochytrium salamandrivorans]
MKATFGEINQEQASETKIRALRQERQQRLVKDSGLVCGQSGHLKPLVPGPTLALGLSDRSKPLKWKAPAMKFRETISADSNFSSLFSEDQAETLPPHRVFDCSIDLKPGSEPFHGKIYQLTREEDKVMQEWIKDNLRKGFIRISRIGTPIPLISELLRTLSTGKIFTTLDLRGAYIFFASRKETSPRLRLSRSTDSLSSWSLPFGLANAPAQFQRMMNSLFRDVIGKHVLVYLDDIVIYSDNMSDHIAQVQNVLRVLQDNGLYCKAEKCHFYKSEIKYLGYIISADGLRMDPSKISAVQSWPTPKKVRDLQVLLGFTNFYRALIHDYSSMTANLTKLFKKDAPFVWGPEQESLFRI